MNRQAVEGAFHMLLAPAAAADTEAQRRVCSGAVVLLSQVAMNRQAVDGAFHMLLAPAADTHRAQRRV
jgi:hypothetical protein